MWNIIYSHRSWHEDRWYFHTAFPSFIQDKQLDINYLEFLVIIVACKLWGKLWKGKRLVVRCDNLVASIPIGPRTSSCSLACKRCAMCPQHMNLKFGGHIFQVWLIGSQMHCQGGNWVMNFRDSSCNWQGQNWAVCIFPQVVIKRVYFSLQITSFSH